MLETNFINKPVHPCIHCQNPCYGSQCKDCHLKMMSERQSNCIDCNTTFNALKKDGSKKKRCFECQKTYNKKRKLHAIKQQSK